MNENGNKYALAALKEQRGKLAGELASLKKRFTWLETQLIHVDATIHLLSPETNTDQIPAIRPNKRIKLFRQGELGRMITDALRRAGKPLQTQDVVSAVMAEGGHDESARAALAPRVRGNLHYLETHGRIVKAGHGRGVTWGLKQTTPSVS